MKNVPIIPNLVTKFPKMESFSSNEGHPLKASLTMYRRRFAYLLPSVVLKFQLGCQIIYLR